MPFISPLLLLAAPASLLPLGPSLHLFNRIVHTLPLAPAPTDTPAAALTPTSTSAPVPTPTLTPVALIARNIHEDEILVQLLPPLLILLVCREDVVRAE